MHSVETWHLLKYTNIVLDIDGTLLHSNRSVSHENLQALKKCVEAGIDIWIATARSHRSVFGETGPLHDIDYIEPKGAFHNGAYAVNKVNGYLKHYPIEPTLVTKIMDMVEAKGPHLKVAIQNQEDHSFKFIDPETMEFWSCTEEECIEYSTARTSPALKIAVWDEKEDLTQLYESLMACFGEELNIFLSGNNTWILILSKKASKDQALLDMYSYHGVSPDKVVTFGDDLNDLGMIQTFGCGIAMGNAIQPIKDAAKHVTKTNDEHGVNHALREILKII